MIRRSSLAIVMATILAGLAGFAVGWFGPSSYEAEGVLFVRRIAADEPTTAELKDLIEEIEVAVVLPYIGNQITDEAAIDRGEDYELTISSSEQADGVVRFRAVASSPAGAEYVARRAPALVVALFTDQDIQRSEANLEAAERRIEASVDSGVTAGAGVSPLARSAASSRVDIAAAKSARVAFDSGGLTTTLGPAQRISPWEAALWSGAVGAVGAAVAAVIALSIGEWVVSRSRNEESETE